jgi:hypothetical protein
MKVSLDTWQHLECPSPERCFCDCPNCLRAWCQAGHPKPVVPLEESVHVVLTALDGSYVCTSRASA